MKYIFSLLLISIFTIIFPSPASAAQTPNCAPIYGGSKSCEQIDPLVINKQVQNPDTQAYVDNLTTNDPSYLAGDIVRFKITIANSSNASLREVVLKDILPTQIDFSKGAGKYDPKTRTLIVTINELKKKETKVYFIEGKVVSQDKLPKDQQMTCVINQAEVSDEGKVSRDNARVCIDRGTITTTTAPSTATTTKGGTTIHPPTKSKRTPDTGPEALALIGFIPLGALGFYLKNKAKT